MAKKPPRPKVKDTGRRTKKKISILNAERVGFIDYKDVNLLRRFMSDRAKIRARRVTGNDTQQQREIAKAIKNAREMALLPYATKVTSTRSSRDRGDRGDRGDREERGRADGPPPRPSGPPPNGEGVDELEVTSAASADSGDSPDSPDSPDSVDSVDSPEEES
jgi:small subunit ribosomal protein S18